MRRNVRDRASALTPFPTYDPDPYIVLGNDGRLSWIMDAFTVSDSYPYSSHYRLDGNLLNYTRNSVKVVVDAYDGTSTFYVFDTEDPVIATYRPPSYTASSSGSNGSELHRTSSYGRRIVPGSRVGAETPESTNCSFSVVLGRKMWPPPWQAGGQPITQRASCCLHRTSEHHPTAAYPHFPVPKIAALPRVHSPKHPMYSQSRAAA
jgi:Uncharacterised protein family (UPF0182)